MADILTPTLGESVSEATVAKWTKKSGEAVKKDELLLELETDKVSLEVVAPADGVLTIDAAEGATVTPGQKLGSVGGAGAQPASAPAATKPATAASPAGEAQPEPQPNQPTPKEAGPVPDTSAKAPTAADTPLAPSVQRIVTENNLDVSGIKGAGRDGRITKGDALAALEARSAPAPEPVALTPRPADAREERVRMSRLRQTIARRLKDAQNTAAMLTTFNEVDMSAVMTLRAQYKDLFEKKHGVKLGFMSFFVKAVTAALKEVPAVNAEIDGQDLVYKNHYDIGIAVGTDKGLVVPIVRDADRMSLAEIEKKIGELGKRARDGHLAIDDLQGGTFSITNGGIYGSLMSTPILNPPQSGILGMHAIKDRPVVVGGEIKIRPMMYLALSYDHRVVDGQGAVTFLVKIKEHIEEPQRLLMDL